MHTDINPHTKCHPSSVPLFDFRRAVVRPVTRAGKHLSRRYLLAPSIADTIAELAGLGERGAG